jgi:hypothetical protein
MFLFTVGEHGLCSIGQWFWFGGLRPKSGTLSGKPEDVGELSRAGGENVASLRIRFAVLSLGSDLASATSQLEDMFFDLLFCVRCDLTATRNRWTSFARLSCVLRPSDSCWADGRVSNIVYAKLLARYGKSRPGPSIVKSKSLLAVL